MSARRRKAAFDPGALGDLDDLLPSLSIVTETTADSSETQSAAPENSREDSPLQVDAEPTAEPPQPAPVPDEESSEAEELESEPALPQPEATTLVAPPRRKAKPRGDTAPTRVAPPEVYLPPAVYTALRELTLEERQRDRATARAYGQVVLDAVEKHAHELQRHWTAEPVETSGGLFKRRDVGTQPRRRRHSEIQARVPLAGIIASDTATLDALAEEWSAGSRSALVEQALRLYLDVRAD
jgi:hypothetical protein